LGVPRPPTALKPTEYEDLEPRSEVLHRALELVSDRSLEAHGFALSSVVVNARTGVPGSGFFETTISRWPLPNAQKVHSRVGIDPESPGYRMWSEQARQAIKHYNRQHRRSLELSFYIGKTDEQEAVVDRKL
jgi:hypothetical protein